MEKQKVNKKSECQNFFAGKKVDRKSVSFFTRQTWPERRHSARYLSHVTRRHPAESMPSTQLSSRLAARLGQLPHEVLADLAAQLCSDSPALEAAAEECMAAHTPLPHEPRPSACCCRPTWCI